MFCPVPEADYVYCGDGIALPLASTAFVRYCQATWKIVHSAKTWGEFADSLEAIDLGLLEAMFPDGLEAFLEESELVRADPFGGWTDIDGTYVGGQLSFSGYEDGPYRSWDDFMPEEIIDLASWGTSMTSGDFCYLELTQLPTALEVIEARGETAAEDCRLLEELGWLFNDGTPEMPPGWETLV